MAQSQSASRKWWAPVAIGLVAVAMIVIVIFSNQGPSPTPPTAEQEPSGTDQPAVAEPPEVSPPQRLHVEYRDADDPAAIGDPDAPVALVMYSDFQCSFCALWADQTLPGIMDRVEAGELRIEWRDIAIFGEASYRGALAGVAAGRQDAYIEFNQELFAGGSAPSASTLTDEGLAALAEEMGLDVEQFQADMSDPETELIVQTNLREAQELGITSTPTFLINGLGIIGAQPLEYFQSAIEQELSLNS